MEEEVGKFPQAVAEIYNSLLAISLFLPTSLPFSVCVVAIDRLPTSPNFFSLSCLRIPLFIMIRYIDCRGSISFSSKRLYVWQQGRAGDYENEKRSGKRIAGRTFFSLFILFYFIFRFCCAGASW